MARARKHPKRGPCAPWWSIQSRSRTIARRSARCAPRYESDLGFRVSGKVDRALGGCRRVGQEGRRAGAARRAGLSQQAEIGGSRHRRGGGGAGGGARARGRLRQLLASGATTRANYDAALKNLRSAEAKLDSAKASRDLAKDQLGYTELIAEFDGVVTAVGAEPGQVVNVGQMIVRLARPDRQGRRLRHRRIGVPSGQRRPTSRPRSSSRC